VRVALDLSGLQSTRVGVDRYMTGLVSGLAAIDGETRYEVFAPRPDRDLFGSLPGNFSVHAAAPRPRVFRLGFQQLLLPALSLGGRIDVLHSPGVHMPLAGGRCRHLLTVHDMTQVSHPDLHTRLRGSAPYRWMLKASIARAGLIVVPTAHVRTELLARASRTAPGDVRVIPHGLDPAFSPSAGERAEETLARLGVRRPFVLSVGTLEPRKSLGTLVDAFRQVELPGPPSTLALVGARGWRSEDLHRAIEAEDGSRVRWLGHVPDPDLATLYATAEVFVYPSIEEGFGFPPLEAMACRTATIACDASAMAENLGGAATLVPPGDPAALAAALRKLLGDGEARARLARAGRERAARFRREGSARAHLALYRELAGEA
jgi:glycosyltransferase involved in cell wall biosynthesis